MEETGGDLDRDGFYSAESEEGERDDRGQVRDRFMYACYNNSQILAWWQMRTLTRYIPLTPAHTQHVPAEHDGGISDRRNQDDIAVGKEHQGRSP